jgi:hypothetical protein
MLCAAALDARSRWYFLAQSCFIAHWRHVAMPRPLSGGKPDIERTRHDVRS